MRRLMFLGLLFCGLVLIVYEASSSSRVAAIRNAEAQSMEGGLPPPAPRP